MFEFNLLHRARRIRGLVFVATTMLLPATALAQIEPPDLGPAGPTPPIGRDLPPDRRPSGLKLTAVGDFLPRFSAEQLVLDLTAHVGNAGDADGEFLLLVDVLGAEDTFVSSLQRVESGENLEVPLRVIGEFNCRGTDRISVVVRLVDEWTRLDARGAPLRPREVARSMNFVEMPFAIMGKLAKFADCHAGDPFAGGFREEADRDTPPPVMTRFVPAEHGFNFGNSFRNDFITEWDIKTGGLCGGMTYAALDYYYEGRELPQQDYRPADHTTLYRYLYDRQTNSIVRNYGQWFELRQNPEGARNSEFFNWGLNERLADIREFIDRGDPALLGLKGANGSGDHQVIAIGYHLGRFPDEPGVNGADTKIYVYDPNFPNKIMTLVPHMDRELFYYEEKQKEVVPDDSRPDDEKKGKYYQGYFVDRTYRPNVPPRIENPAYPDDGLIYEIIVGIETAGDDLREGAQAHITVVKRDGTEQFEENINGTRRWLDHYMQFVRIELEGPVPYQDLKELRLAHRSGGRQSTPDNWDVGKIWVSARGHDRRVIYDVAASPLVRFKGNRRTFTAYLDTVPAPDDYIRQVDITLQTGGDNLRGQDDNVDAFILFADGTSQHAEVINNFYELPNNMAMRYPVVLEAPRPRAEIRGLRLIKTRGNDKWNLDVLKVDFTPMQGMTYTWHLKRDTPLFRFTRTDRFRDFEFD